MTVRWGICGTGRIAHKFHEGLSLVPDAEAVAVASRTPVRAQEFAADHGIAAHGDQGWLAGLDDVDVVYVAVTQDAHRDVVLSMLEAGHHVLCEKPLALSEAQATEMTGAAGRQQRFLMEAMWSRFSPVYVRMAQLLAADAIGEVLSVQADLSLRIADDQLADHRLLDPARGGGALLDVGIYPLQLASLVLGPPTEVRAIGHLGPSGVDEQVAVLLDHPGGAQAVLTASIRMPGPRTARISGTSGSITLGVPMHAPTSLTLEADGAVEVIECGPPGLHLQVPEVHRCLAEGLLESSVMPWAESRSLLRTADEVRRQIGMRYPGE